MTGAIGEFFAFDTVVNTIIIIASFLLYRKTRELYKLSLQKGIRYISYAMLFYVFSFLFRYAEIFIVNFGESGSVLRLAFVFLNLLFASVGGLYLAYSLVWRMFETRFKSHKKFAFMIFFVSFIVALFEIYIIIFYEGNTPFLFFGLMFLVLGFAISSNCKRCKFKGPDISPFISLVGLGLGVYIVLFLESIFFKYLFTVHYYAWALATVFTLTFLYYVYKLIDF